MLSKVKLYGDLAEFVGHKQFDVKDETVVTGGKNSIQASIENFGEEPSRIMTRILDIGTLPAGKRTEDEVLLEFLDTFE